MIAHASLRRPALLLALAGAALCAGAGAGVPPVAAQEQRPRLPNILWLTCEDMGPHIGPYGDRYAVTPNLDRFAARSLRYETAWSNAPVCAPARTALISGLYPTSTGSEHMRSLTRLPAGFKMYPQFLREAGYYCTNHSKTDYNLAEPGKVWDESSGRAHWKNRAPGQPFFAVFNFTITHESQMRKRPHTLVHDPAKAPLPAYHPDTPEVRRDWAQYYDNITTMDREFGERLEELEKAGLAEDTLVFFYSDHGSGMPRNKRWPYSSGLRVPLLVHVPEKYRHLAPPDYRPGGTTGRLVSFVDFAPTLLSLIGRDAPEYLQGHAFMGPRAAPPQPYLYGFRGRMDERYDLVRSVGDGRYVYVRNYMPHRIYGQHLGYMFETPTTRVWKRLYDEGALKPPQTRFWEPKPAEELYDLRSDPHEVVNLAGSPAHRAVLERMRKASLEHLLRVRDVGFLPEGEIHSRAAGSTPYEMARDPHKYPLSRILETAELASEPARNGLDRLRRDIRDPDSAVRFWAATGLLVRGAPAAAGARASLRQALSDASPYVRAVAAEALGKHGNEEDLRLALEALRETAPPEKSGVFGSMLALTAIDELGGRAAPLLPLVRTLGTPVKDAPPRTGEYVPRLVEKITGERQP